MTADKSGDREVLKGYKILVVDDEPDARTLITSILKDHGAVTIEAEDGDQALAKAKAEKPDLMTLDLSMPGKSGIDVFVILRDDDELMDIPICVITGQPEMRKLIFERPADRPPEGYMDKPVTEKALLRNIRKILELRDR